MLLNLMVYSIQIRVVDIQRQDMMILVFMNLLILDVLGVKNIIYWVVNYIKNLLKNMAKMKTCK